MRVVVTWIGPEGAMRRRMADAAASGDAGPWEELIARALAAPPPYRPVPGVRFTIFAPVERVVPGAGHDLSGALYELVTAVLAFGGAPP
jgi:hypothetical protein